MGRGTAKRWRGGFTRFPPPPSAFRLPPSAFRLPPSAFRFPLSAVILGLDPRIQCSAALFLADFMQADGWILGSSPRMTAGNALPRLPDPHQRLRSCVTLEGTPS
ncbi:hypothetical protein DA69_10005 [Brevundimonas naejangsanensis]|uniref:Uncharacterized protein n=1 Tax=Brevundimonas naejangsanensis TaxID=588932 RepID=A0A172Y7N0_9CAUL|nr:hypothetical protein DA69_10005 [Brevundimonas naejangsanensis]